ncbi:hypothetical protein R5R35_014140 [Gryllus longicercus]|uniref:Accessory gland protein n=1 Tax=Gryllus longicercus TaxID=2509291 RepID=A0AAN9VCP2_9ORTH
MGLAGVVLLLVLCSMLQVPPSDSARIVVRSHHHPPSLDHSNAHRLSKLCCGEGQFLDIASAACRTPRSHRAPSPGPGPGPAHSLLQRSGLTDLPPNCPKPQKYDPEAKVCREPWRKRR